MVTASNNRYKMIQKVYILAYFSRCNTGFENVCILLFTVKPMYYTL